MEKLMKKGFTLVETLLTMGIIGIIAGILIPALNNGIQNMEYKTAYKKAYSELSQAFVQAIANYDLTPRTAGYDAVATDSEWNVIKSAFKVAKECTRAQLNSCWAAGDKIYQNGYPNTSVSLSFVDVSGRSWAQYCNDENIYIVDTNGFKPPNQFGKDRWIFIPQNSDGTRTSVGLPAKIGNFRGDKTTMDVDWCRYPPCYYQSWLYDQ